MMNIALTYHYDADYADEQVKTGGGAFLEFHEFAQTITPLDPDTRGFVTLAAWNKLHTQLAMIAIQIPYGYTLIVDKHCIHGDTTLDGLFLMCMTSDHISMATADTVFLKQAQTKDNINLKLDTVLDSQPHQRTTKHLDPLVFQASVATKQIFSPTVSDVVNTFVATQTNHQRFFMQQNSETDVSTEESQSYSPSSSS